MKYQVINDFVLGNMVAEVKRLMAEGKSPLVTIEDKKIDRSTAQNNLMHLWFRDIANSTKQGITYEGGRCKIQYFLPILRYSKKEKAQFAIDLCELAYRERGYEYLQRALGESFLESTRHLATEEFAEALTNMQMGEAEHNLTNPELHGYRWVHDSKGN